jgi:hypothetical protein
MSWETPQLLVMFSDRDLSVADLEPVPPFLNGWVYSRPGEGLNVALETPEGITVGSSIADLLTAYVSDVLLPAQPEVCGGD